MRIITYEFADLHSGGLSFSKLQLGKINLVVGDTASGKTRFLNTIFNLGASVAGQRQFGGPSQWKLTFDHEGIQYGLSLKSIFGNKPIPQE